MFPLRCTVRKCDNLLHPGDGMLRCEAGHSFDQAKQGYWNLTQPQDKKSLNPGDNDDAVTARNQWLTRGHMTSLVDAVRPWVESITAQPMSCLDLGCGEGTFGRQLFTNLAAQYCGIDLSRKAIRLACRSWPHATWVLANADRILPAHDESVDCVLSLFGRRPVSEIQRVIAPHGRCIVAVPGADDMVELREITQGSGTLRSRWEAVVEEFHYVDLPLIEHATWRIHAALDTAAITDALAMTYRAVRNSQRERLNSELTELTVTLSADLMLFGK